MSDDIHIRDEASDFKERSGSGIPLFMMLCGQEAAPWEHINPPEEERDIPEHPSEPTCLGCIMVQLQNQAEAQEKARQYAERLFNVVQAFYPPDES